MNYLSVSVLVCFLSFIMTGALKRYALSRDLIDIPNTRSSHTTATPRGGGVAIVLAFLLVVPVLGWFHILAWASIVSIAGAGLWVAVIGFMDDHGHIAARWRLLGHFSAGAWALYWLGGLPPFILLGININLGVVGNCLALIYLVWMLNLYNFMDGIDGIASIEAVCSCLSMCVLYALGGHDEVLWLPLLLAMAVFGFAFWNFPPARIFMGDAGSGFLGITVGILVIQAAWISSSAFWAWLILLGVFIVDATATLIRRLLRGEKVYEAHRSHAYQFASREFGKHLPVTLGVAGINVLWLFPIAYAVTFLGLDGALGLIFAYIPLCFLAWRFKAGAPEK